MISVLLVVDHVLMRQTLRNILERHADLAIVGETESGESAVNLARALQPVCRHH
jgi:DNA-binding NarL/FixJ family response regulator